MLVVMLIRCSCRLRSPQLPTNRLQVHSFYFSSSPASYLRKAPAGVNRILGVPVTYLPWPSQFARAVMRRYMNPEKLGDEAYRQKVHLRLSLVYFVCVWSLVCLFVVAYNRNLFEGGSQEDDGIRPGSAMWYYTKVKAPNDALELQKIKVYKFNGFSAAEECDITDEVRKKSVSLLQDLEESDDVISRKRVGLPLQKEKTGSEEETPRRKLTYSEFIAKHYKDRNTPGDPRPDDELPDDFQGNLRRYGRRFLRATGIWDEEMVPSTRKNAPAPQPLS